MIDWTKITTVFLDLDGTLLDLHFDNHFWLEYVPQCYALKHSLSIEASHDTLRQKYSAAYGSLNWYCVEYWTQELGLDIASLKHSIREKICVRPHVEEFLQALRMSGRRVVLVTNAHPLSFEIKLQETGLGQYFHRIITSHELSYAKEEAEFWLRLAEIEPVDKAATLFIDDNFEVLDAAKRYGIEHLLAIKRPDSTEKDKEHPHYHLLASFKGLVP
ncbi:GMP/IMP nucleotidase YrfG [hydrothermal vent metagenome]|uniref:GMP/IMP nucleotidase YrfG n=1 Tax=hydrothermal vent metagenome TaxID=652676 RepID=A0A3B0Y4K6_9ZZZZ